MPSGATGPYRVLFWLKLKSLLNAVWSNRAISCTFLTEAEKPSECRLEQPDWLLNLCWRSIPDPEESHENLFLKELQTKAGFECRIIPVQTSV